MNEAWGLHLELARRILSNLLALNGTSKLLIIHLDYLMTKKMTNHYIGIPTRLRKDDDNEKTFIIEDRCSHPNMLLIYPIPAALR